MWMQVCTSVCMCVCVCDYVRITWNVLEGINNKNIYPLTDASCRQHVVYLDIRISIIIATLLYFEN